MFNKIYNFIDDYSDLIVCIILLFIAIFVILFFGSYIDKINKREFDIINKTKDYTMYSSCKKISDKFYCWED